MSRAVDSLLVLVMLLNFAVLGQSRLRAVVNAAALQGMLLGVAALAAHDHLEFEGILVAVAAIALKGFLIPGMLLRAMREAVIRREVEPIVGFTGSLLLGALATGLAVAFAHTLPMRASPGASLVVPASIATVLTGFLVLTTRRKAITQVVGYLILENGIFAMGLVLIEAMPFMVEVGVLLDLFVGIFVMGIIIHHIHREFSSLDTARLSELKE